MKLLSFLHFAGGILKTFDPDTPLIIEFHFFSSLIIIIILFFGFRFCDFFYTLSFRPRRVLLMFLLQWFLY